MARIVADPPVVEARCKRFAQALLDRADDESADGWRVAKPHFGFRGVDVDVDFGGLAFDEQGRDRVPIGRQEIEIGRAQRADERLVAHRTSVDEQELLGGVRPAVGRHAARPESLSASRRASSATELSGEIVAQRLAQALSDARFARACGRPVETCSRCRSRTKSALAAQPSPAA